MNVSRRGFLWLSGAAGASFAGGCASGRLFTGGAAAHDPNLTVSERSGTSVPSTCTLYESSFSAAAAHIARQTPAASIWSLVIFFSFL